MTARRAMGVVAVMVAGLILLLFLGLLLLAPGEEMGAGPRPARGARAIPAPPAPGKGPTAIVSAGDTQASAPPPPGSKAGPLELAVEAALEDGTPVEGVSFLAMVRGEGNVPEVSLEPEAVFKEATNAGGKATLRWKEAPVEILLLVLCRRAEVVSVEGGSLLGPESAGEVVHAPAGPGPLRLAMRFRPGTGTIALVDVRTGQPPPDPGLWNWKVRHPDGSREPAWKGGVALPSAGGFPIDLPLLPRPDPPMPDGRVLEIVVPGSEVVRIPLAELRGPREVRLEPAAVAVTGEITVPRASEGDRVPVRIWFSRPGGSALEERTLGGLPNAPGRFAVTGVEDGTWVMGVMAWTTSGAYWARREFTRAGGAADLGTVEVSGRAGLRLRLLDASGTPQDARKLQLAPTEAVFSSSGVVRRADRRLSGQGIVVHMDGRVEIQPPPEASDPEGWVEVADLPPSTAYRITVLGHPGVGVDVETPPNGGTAAVEVRLPARMVACRIRCALAGGAAAGWRGFEGTTTDLSVSVDPDLLRASFPPGRQEITAQVQRKRGGPWEAVRAGFDVPDAETFETTLTFE